MLYVPPLGHRFDSCRGGGPTKYEPARPRFGIYSGIVPDGIADLGVEDVDWAGDSTILLSYVKGRAAAESMNPPSRPLPLPAKIRINGHEYAKRQAALAGIEFTELSNGIAATDDPAGPQAICDPRPPPKRSRTAGSPSCGCH
jgi:hypothetical protein